jgi:translation initiation factor 6 (eIF-6)
LARGYGAGVMLLALLGVALAGSPVKKLQSVECFESFNPHWLLRPHYTFEDGTQKYMTKRYVKIAGIKGYIWATVSNNVVIATSISISHRELSDNQITRIQNKIVNSPNSCIPPR